MERSENYLRITGAFLLLIYGLLAIVQPYRATAGRSFLYVSDDELRFWLAHWMLAAPGIVLIAVSHRHGNGPSLWDRLLAFDRSRWLTVALGYVGLLVVLAIAGRKVFLLDLPITDDENVVLFGARMLAAGHLSVPILQPDGAFTDVFTYRHLGSVSAMAYPGELFFRAASLVTRLDSHLYALAAAGTGLAVAATASALLGRRGAVVAACWWICSPMAFTLGMTTHSHVASRFFLAVSLWLYVRLLTKSAPGVWNGIALGLTGGLAFLVRSPEAACILLPIAIHVIASAIKQVRLRRALYGAALASVIVLAGYAWYNLGTTGIWYVESRFGPGVYRATPNFPGTPLSRLAFNFGHNFLLLLIMALGPLGALFVALGMRSRGPLAVFAAGIGLQFALQLLHDDTGIHTVGPIHLSETLLGLVLLASNGVLSLLSLLQRQAIPLTIPSRAVGAYVLGGLALFTAVHSYGMRNQAANSAAIYDTVKSAALANAVVVGDPPSDLIHSHPGMRETGSWVHWFPPPDPFFRDEVIYAYANNAVDLLALRNAFPDRHFYRMTYHHSGSPVTLTALDP